MKFDHLGVLMFPKGTKGLRLGDPTWEPPSRSILDRVPRREGLNPLRRCHCGPRPPTDAMVVPSSLGHPPRKTRRPNVRTSLAFNTRQCTKEGRIEPTPQMSLWTAPPTDARVVPSSLGHTPRGLSLNRAQCGEMRTEESGGSVKASKLKSCN
jgi:hypothetical protein